MPVLDNDPDDSTWTAELSTGTDDDAMNFEKRSFVPHPSAKRIRISKTLLRLSAIPVAPLVSERLAYKFAITEEKAFLTGTGSNQPLGLFTNNANGITSANRWVSSGNTNVALKADNLINVKYALKMQYRANAQWIFHRDVIKVIRRLKDGEGNYLWQTSIAADKPDTLLGYPVNESEYAPSTMTTLLAVGILGDFSYYWIVDALDMQIQVLTELYAEKNQNGYIARMETDGMPVVEEAFAVCQMA